MFYASVLSSFSALQQEEQGKMVTFTSIYGMSMYMYLATPSTRAGSETRSILNGV